MECEKKNENPDGVLAQAEPMLNFFKRMKEERRADKLRIQELEALLKETRRDEDKLRIQELEAYLKEIRQERDNLQMIVDNLQNIFKDFNNHNSTNPFPVSSAESITDMLTSSSSSTTVNLKNSPRTNINVKAAPSLSVDGEAQEEISAVLKNDKTVRVEIAIQTESAIVDAGVPNINNLEASTAVENENEAVPSRVDIEVQTDHDNIAIDSNREKKQISKTTRSAVCKNEIAPDKNDISNYFSSFYVDSQTDSYDENTPASLASQRMVLSSSGGLDKGCVTLLFNENFATQNLPPVQQNHDSSQSSLGNENVHFLYSINNCNLITTADDANEYDQEGRHYNDDHDYQIPVKCEYGKSTAVKRGRRPTNKSNTKKTKPSFVWVSDDEPDSDYIPGGQSSTSEDSYEPLKKKKKKKTFKVKCKVCEIDHKTQCFNTYRALDRHLLKKHSLNTFPTYLRCPYDENCMRHYAQKSSLLNHIKSNHPDKNSSLLMNCRESRQRSWECACCSVTFISHRLFQWHMDKFHPGSVESAKLSQTPESVGNVSDVKTQSKTETPEKLGRTIIKRIKGKFYVSKNRRLSVSSVDDDYDPDAISIPGKANERRKSTEKVSSLESDRVKAEIHETKTMTTRNEEPPPQPVNPTAVTELEKSLNNSESTDLNDFVLNSINEISSIIEKQNAATSSLPAVTTNSPFLITTNEKTHDQLAQMKNSNEQLQSYLSTSQHKPSSMSLSSLPCLLNDCPGCHYHSKPAITSLTLDDEYVSSCRDEILADLYSIPDNPPMATDICDVTFAFQSVILENTGEQIIPIEDQPNTIKGVDMANKANPPEVENTPNAVSSSREDNYDTANDLRRQSTSDSNNVTKVDDKMKSESEKITCENENDNLRKDVIDSVRMSVPENAAEKIISIEEQPNKITAVDEKMVVSETSSFAIDLIANNDVVDKTILPETSSQESENQFEKIDVNDRVTREDEIPSSQDPSNVVKTSSANGDVLKPTEIDSENQNEVAKVDYKNHEDYQACDLSAPSTDEEQSTMEVDNPELEEPHSSQTDSIDLRSTSQTDKDLLEADVTVLTQAVSSATAYHKSIFDLDDPYCLEKSNQTELTRNFDSSADKISKTHVSESDRPILEKFQNSNRVDSSTICENTSANEVAHCESVHSTPIDDTVDENKPSETTSSTEVINANADEISSPRNMSENLKSITSNEIPPTTPENQNEGAKVDDENQEDYQACDLSASSIDEEQSTMEVDNPEHEEPHSSQTDLIDLRSTSQTDKDLLEANVTVLTQAVSSATAYPKSIFDSDDHYCLEKSNQTELTRNFDSSADEISKTHVSESDRPILEKFQNSNRVDSSTICENTSANEVAHCESVHSTPIDDTVDENKPSETTSSTEVVNANADEIASPRNMSENLKSITSNEIPPPTPDISSPLNVSTSIGNTTFYDEFDLVHACQVETCYEDSRLNTSASSSSQVSPLSVENRPVVDSTPLKYLKRNVSHKSTNEMIEGVQIEIEIEDCVSSQSSAHALESDITQLIPRVEVDEKSHKNDGSNKNISDNGNQQIIETSAIKSSSVCKKLKYPFDPEFSSFVKGMLTEKSLGIAKERPPASSLCMKSRSEFLNSSSSYSTCSSESCSIDDEKHNDHRETDKVPAVELESSHLSPMETGAIREKEDYEVDFIIESQSKSRPILSPLPMSPCSTTQTDQSNNSIEANSGKPENYEDDSSQLTTSSNQRVESDLVFDFGCPSYNISGKTDAELSSIFKLDMFRVVLKRLPIDFKTHSSKYELRRKLRISYASLNSLSSNMKRQASSSPSSNGTFKKYRR